MRCRLRASMTGAAVKTVAAASVAAADMSRCSARKRREARSIGTGEVVKAMVRVGRSPAWDEPV